MKKDDVFILDSYGLIYRAYFAFISRPLTNSQGENISAIYGFFNSLYAVLKKYNPKIFVAAMDSLTPTFRHEMYPEYKMTRDKTPEDLHAQIPVIEDILKSLGIPILRYDGFEADDIIATLAKRAEDEKRKCFVISTDKDLVQLVTDNTKILKTTKTMSWGEFGIEETKEEWGVKPEQILDVLSLMGDSADNVPGVAGIGIKTAQKLLGEYTTLDGIYENIDSIKGAVQKKLIEGKENAYFSKKLIALNYSVPIEKKFEELFNEHFNYKNAVEKFEKYELPNLASVYNDDGSEAEKSTAKTENTTTVVKQKKSGSDIKIQTPLEKLSTATPNTKSDGVYKCIQTEKELADLIEQAIKSELVAFDTETTGTNSLDTKIVGFSFSFTDKTAYYVPLIVPSPELGDELDKTINFKTAKQYLAKLFESKITLVMHNGKFDLQVVKSCKLINKVKAKIFDTMIASWLLDPDYGSFSLDSLSSRLLGIETIKYKDIVEKNKDFSSVNLDIATSYAAEDADITLRLYNKIEPELKTNGLDKLFYDVEMPVLLLLSQMEENGIFINQKELNNFADELGNELVDLEKEIFKIVGHEFNISSPKQLQEVLFDELKLTPGKKTKTGYSTDTSVLEKLASEHTVPAKILEYRGMAKLKSTYAEALPKLTDSESRIHTSFVQTGTATGRLSSRDPNLQNIPIKDEAGRRIRKAFYAVDDNVLVTADYSQIELVILAHLSEDKNLTDAFNKGIDVHAKTASLIFETDIENVNHDMRRIAKTINFGVMYGMSAFRMANELHIPRKQAALFIDTYFKTYSGISTYMNKITEFAEEHGYVETLLGRRRYISAINSNNKIEKAGAERVAINTPIQGSAADIVKLAMITVDKKIKAEKLNAKLLLQVHDELIFECEKNDSEKLIKLLKTEMESVFKLKVPLRVNIESGKSWGDFH